MYGAPSDRLYYNLRLPKKPTTKYVSNYGDRRFITATAPDTLTIGNEGIPVHILDVRVLRGITYTHYWQIRIPPRLSTGIQDSKVRIAYERDMIHLDFGRDLFDDLVCRVPSR